MQLCIQHSAHVRVQHSLELEVQYSLELRVQHTRENDQSSPQRIEHLDSQQTSSSPNHTTCTP